MALERAGFRLEESQLSRGKKVTPKAFKVSKHGIEVGELISGHRLYDYLMAKALDDRSSWEMPLSRRMIPDEAFVNYLDRTLYVLEKKTMNVSGSVDEKLGAFPYVIRRYKKLVSGFQIHGKPLKVKYIYLLDSYFFTNRDDYRDLYEYFDESELPYVVHDGISEFNYDFTMIGLPRSLLEPSLFDVIE